MENDARSGDPSFPEGEFVLAYHPSKDRLHNAKVLKVEFREGEWRYLVHYSRHPLGPNDDLWLTSDRLMEVTMDNLDKQSSLNRGPAGSAAKRLQEAKDVMQRKKRELVVAYETMHEEFTATYGTQIGIEEYILFHVNERTKAPGERRTRPDGGFQFERVRNGEESSRQAAAPANLGAFPVSRVPCAARRRLVNSCPTPQLPKNMYPPYYV